MAFLQVKVAAPAARTLKRGVLPAVAARMDAPRGGLDASRGKNCRKDLRTGGQPCPL